MNSEKCKSAIEAILFASGSSVEASRIAEALEISEQDSKTYLEEKPKFFPIFQP